MREIVLLIAGLILIGGVPTLPAVPWPAPPTPPTVVAPGPATAAVYVYEKDSSAVPTAVTAGLNKLNRERKILANLLEADTTNGGGHVPTQFRQALDAATAAGLPALVVLSGTAVLRVVPAPGSIDAVVEAVP